MPLDPQWGIKKNSESNNVFWYGYKVHLAVATSSQYFLGTMLQSGLIYYLIGRDYIE